MDAADLRVFEAVARHGGMSRAAAELHTVQSNVTARIRQLEEELGTALFQRHSRGVTLTADQQDVANVYASIPMQTRLTVFNDLVGFAQQQTDPLVRAGVMFAAGRFVSQATRIEREKRRKA